MLNHAAPILTTSLLAGYASAIVLDVIGLRRRGLLAQAWALVLTPLHWLLLSIAAWRAVFQLISDPQRWEKTEHGLAKSARVARSAAAGDRKALRPQPLSPLSPIGPVRIMQSARAGTLLG